MNPKKQLRKLFAYDFWAHKKVADALASYNEGKEHKKVFDLFAHISAAEQIWFGRITNQPTDNIMLWPNSKPVAESFKKLEEMNGKWCHLLDAEAPSLDKNISYKNSKGSTFNMALADILHHVIIHGQHHRAQIASLLRQKHINPPPTGYIFYLREN